MSRHFFAGVAMSAGLLFGSASVLAADATIQQVYEAADSGHLDRAKQMMRDVLRDHPNSGKAHFVESELLAKQGDLGDARSELAKARNLEPGLPFAKPAAVQELDNLLKAGSAHAAAASFIAPSHGGMPFGWIAAALMAVALIVFLTRQRSQSNMAGMTSPSSSAAYNYGYGTGPIPPQSTNYGGTPVSSGGLGSGLFGSLATGAAVGAGVVAGEALMHRVLDGSNGQSMVTPVPSPVWDNMQSREQSYDMGGNDFGLVDDTSWDDDASRSSGDDWS